MATTRVPADVDPDSLQSLVQDCRDLPSELRAVQPSVLHLPADAAHRPVDISSAAVRRLDGFGAYGS